MSNEKTNFKLGDRVMTIQDSKPRYGTIRSIGDNGYEHIAIVTFKTDNPNESELQKIKVSDLILVEETEAETKKSEPVEKSEITITPDEFRETGVKVIKKLTAEKPVVGLAFTAFLAELHKALFFGEVSENS